MAGQRYRISCEALFPDGITSPILVEWHGSDGLISNGSGITVGSTLASQRNITTFLEFNPFRTAHGGRFSCRATIMSLTPPFNISKTAGVDIVVGGKFHMQMRGSQFSVNIEWHTFTAVVELPVTIVSSPLAADGGVYAVGSSLDLTCRVQGGYPPLSYSWNSTCSGLCFVLGETVNSVRKEVLHSIDAGNHTCSVVDYTGRTGNTTIQIALSGIDHGFSQCDACWWSTGRLYSSPH
jgi:hypothetical protein